VAEPLAKKMEDGRWEMGDGRRKGGFKNGARTFQSAALAKKRGAAEFFGAVERSRIAADWKVRAPFYFLESAVAASADVFRRWLLRTAPAMISG